jgi:hypothetical protein
MGRREVMALRELSTREGWPSPEEPLRRRDDHRPARPGAPSPTISSVEPHRTRVGAVLDGPRTGILSSAEVIGIGRMTRISSEKPGRYNGLT